MTSPDPTGSTTRAMTIGIVGRGTLGHLGGNGTVEDDYVYSALDQVGDQPRVLGRNRPR